MKQLEEWYNRKNRKPLILKGARQVGKTWLMKEFGRTHFKYTADVNVDNNKNMANIFEEIQENPKAIASLKCFCEEAPEYAIIEAGLDGKCPVVCFD